MCNCSSSPVSICTQCQQGNPCGCPPDYSVMPAPVQCIGNCCPPGYTYGGVSANFPNGYCCPVSNNRVPCDLKNAVPTIPCSDCVETMSSNCIILPAIPCLGVLAGTSLTQFLTSMCGGAFAEVILKAIGLDVAAGSGFCQLVQNCPAPGSGTTPIIGPIVVTFP